MSKQQKIWLAIGAGVTAVLILCCAGLIALVVQWMQPGPEDVVDDYLAALHDKDSSAAASLSCDGSPFGMLNRISTAFEVVDWEIVDSETHERSAEVKARVTYEVLGYAKSDDMVFTVIKEDGDWHVCGMSTR